MNNEEKQEEEEGLLSKDQTQALLEQTYKCHKARADIWSASAAIMYIITIFGFIAGCLGILVMIKWAWNFGG